MSNRLASAIGRITGWDKSPGSVFYIVVPLALLGFGLELAVAIMRYRVEHNPAFIFIWIGMVVLLGVALIPGFKMMRTMKKLSQPN